MKDRFGAKNPRSWILRTHAQTAGVSLMAQQPLNNIVRTTVQALAAVLGGTQSLHTNSYDETYALPTEEAATLALRTQQIIAEESGVAQVADPLGGSYFVERLTDQMEEAAMAYIRKIDEPQMEILRIGMDIEHKQLGRLSKLKARRDEGRVRQSLGRLREVASASGNTMPVLLDAARAYATLGEMMDVLREVFGQYEEEAVF